MPTALELTNTVQDGVIKAVETTQRWTLGTVRKTAEAFDGFLPETPKLPLVDRLPSPQQALDAGFDFAERLLAAQRSFVTEVAALAAKSRPVVVTPAKKASA